MISSHSPLILVYCWPDGHYPFFSPPAPSPIRFVQLAKCEPLMRRGGCRWDLGMLRCQRGVPQAAPYPRRDVHPLLLAGFWDAKPFLQLRGGCSRILPGAGASQSEAGAVSSLSCPFVSPAARDLQSKGAARHPRPRRAPGGRTSGRGHGMVPWLAQTLTGHPN